LHDTGMFEVHNAIQLFLHYNPKAKYTNFITPAGLGLIIMEK
jgi:hypothetical protein